MINFSPFNFLFFCHNLGGLREIDPNLIEIEVVCGSFSSDRKKHCIKSVIGNLLAHLVLNLHINSSTLNLLKSFRKRCRHNIYINLLQMTHYFIDHITIKTS